MITDRDEILIQRCVDNELTTEERQELFRRMDETPDGWKSLSCCFIEEQLFRSATCDDAEASSAAEAARAVADTKAKSHWLSHPNTSLVLSLGIALLAGILIRGEWMGATQPEVTAVTPQRETPQQTDVADESSSRSDIRVQLVGDGIKSQSLPYFPAKDYVTGSESEWQRISDLINSRVDTRNQKVRTIWLSINGETIVIPVLEDSTPSPFQ